MYRFWPEGIQGDIPKIRFLVMPLLLTNKSCNWKLEYYRPIKWLICFSNKVAKEISIPKFFNRYGYPYFINLTVSKYNIKNPINLHQYKNTITYANESSKLSPFGVFVNLLAIFCTFHFNNKNEVTIFKLSNFRFN